MTDTPISETKVEETFTQLFPISAYFFLMELTILKAPELPARDYEILVSSSKTQVSTSASLPFTVNPPWKDYNIPDSPFCETMYFIAMIIVNK